MVCQDVAARAQCVVVSVDYGLAPEARWPTQVKQCYAALCWMTEHAADLGIDAARISIEGSVISWPQNYTAGETTQIDLQPSNITVTQGPNIEQVLPYAAGRPLNVTISSGIQSFSLKTFSEIRITPPAYGQPSASSIASSSPSPQSVLQSLQNSIGSGLLLYSGSFASFITIGYFASGIAVKIRNFRT